MTTSTPVATPVGTAFRPRRFLGNGHLQTIVGNFLRRVDVLPPAVPYLVEVAPAEEDRPASQVLCHCHFQPLEVRSGRPTAIIVHGLEGSSNSRYIHGVAARAWAAGS